ncbi:MAG: hypothetical protein OEZ10_13470 [Gammaproteobacteria bacterium]|nr:hypothetical protein [Gammaproteobacteria bacterium]
MMLLVLPGCVTQTEKIGDQHLEEIKRTKIAVSFYDSKKIFRRINSVPSPFSLTPFYDTSYESSWVTSSKDITAMHTASLSGYGLDVVSIHDVFDAEQMATFLDTEKKLYDYFYQVSYLNESCEVNQSCWSTYDNSKPVELDPGSRQALLSKDIKFLVWITWIHPQIVTWGGYSRFELVYYILIYDIESNKRIWKTRIGTAEEPGIEADQYIKHIKDDNFSGLRLQLEKSFRSRYAYCSQEDPDGRWPWNKLPCIGKMMGIIDK